MVDCANNQQYTEAAFLYLVAKGYAYYDIQRINDKSVSQGGFILEMNNLNKIPDESKKKLSDAYNQLIKETTGTDCKILFSFGAPNYYPEYMILHGMGAITKSNSQQEALREIENPQATWEKLITDKLKCQR